MMIPGSNEYVVKLFRWLYITTLARSAFLSRELSLDEWLKIDEQATRRYHIV